MVSRTDKTEIHGNDADATNRQISGNSQIDGQVSKPLKFETDRFELFEEIARGGMGSVVKGRDLLLKRELAVKVLIDSSDEKTVERFFEEAQISGQLQHPGIVPVYEVGRLKDSRPYFAMKLIKGSTLRELLDERDDAEADRQRFLGIFEQVCQTVAYVHSRRVIHRDLKPSNIMVGAFGEVQVMDWGVAKVLQEPESKKAIDTVSENTVRTKILTVRHDNDEGRQTKDGVVFGTLAYMSPEQAIDDKDVVAEPSDVFGLGAILCEILTGEPPYEGKTTKKLYKLAARGEMADVWSRLDDCSADQELIDLAKRCLEYEPEARPANAGVVADEMTRYFESVELRLRESELERTKQLEEKKRHKFKLALVGAMISSVLIAAASAVWIQKKQVAFEHAKRVAAETEVMKQKEIALVEEKARISAQTSQVREQELREKSDKLKQNTEWMLSDLSADRGVIAGENGDAGAAIMWFAEAARLAGADKTRRSNNLIRASNWTRASAIPVGAIDINGRPMEMEFQPAGSLLLTHFNPLNYDYREALEPSTVFKNQTSPELKWLEEIEMPKVPHTKHPALFTVFDWKTSKEVPWLESKTNRGIAAWSPSGSLLAIGKPDGTVEIRSAFDGTVKETFSHGEEIFSLVFSPDGSQLGVAGLTMKIWDFEKGRFKENISWKHPTEVHSLSFNQDGSLIAAIGLDSVGRIYSAEESVQTEEPLLQFPHLYLYSYSLYDRRHPAVWLSEQEGQRRIAGTCGLNEFAIWDVDSGKVLQRCVSEDYSLGEMQITKAGKLVIAGDGKCQIRNPDDYSEFQERGVHSDVITSAKLSRDGKTLLTGSLDTTARLWSAEDGASLGAVMKHGSGVGSIAISDDQTWLATATMNGLVRVWKTPESQKSQRLDWSWASRTACYSPNGEFVVGRKSDGGWSDFKLSVDEFRVFDSETGEQVGSTIKPVGKTCDTCFAFDNQSVIAAHHDTDGHEFVSAFNLESGNERTKSIPLTGIPSWIESHPSKPLVAVVCQDKKLSMIDMEREETLFTLQLECRTHWYSKIRFTPDGKKLIVCNQESFQALDVVTGEACFAPVEYPNSNHENCVLSISPDSKTLAVSSSDCAMFWSLSTATEVGTPLIHAQTSHYLGAVSGMEFSPDSNLLITACSDHYARLWDWRTGEQVCPPMKHSDQVHCAAFTPDGKYAVTGSHGKDCGPHLWELKTGMRVAPSWKAKIGEEDTYIQSVSVSPNGRNLFATNRLPSHRKYMQRYEFEDLRSQGLFSIPQLKQIGELTSSKQITLGRSENLPQANWLELWDQFARRNPRFSHEIGVARKLR